MCVCWSGSSFAVVRFFSSYFQRSLLECLATKANIQRSNVCLSIKVCSSAGSDMLLKPLESVKSALRGLGGDWFLLWYFECGDCAVIILCVLQSCSLKVSLFDANIWLSWLLWFWPSVHFFFPHSIIWNVAVQCVLSSV